MESGDSISISLKGLSEEQWFTVQLDDDLGRQWSFAKLSSDQAGELDTGVLLFQMGVKDTHFDFTQGVGFKTFAEADAFFAAGHYFILTVKDQNGEIVSQRQWTFPPRISISIITRS